MDVFEQWLNDEILSGPENTPVADSSAGRQPFLATLWLHTNHQPHPALPEFYHAYTDVYGNPAGDYLGTLTQMDHQVCILYSG